MALYDRLKNPITRAYVELLHHHHDREGAKDLQRALLDIGKPVTVDGDIGPITINAIKSVPNKKLFEALWLIRHPLKTVQVASGSLPAWLEAAYGELGVKECRGKGCSNPRVEQYHDAIGLGWAKDDVPWCAAFVGWAMLKAGYDLPPHPAAALSWLNFGKSAHRPVLGAIAVKRRKGGGHVTFVVGISADKRTVYCLGGNQNDAVNIKPYPVSVFKDFRVPADYDYHATHLPVLTDRIARSGQIREA